MSVLVGVASFMLVVRFGVVLVGVGLLMSVTFVNFLGKLCAFVDVNFCRRDSAAVDFFYFERCIDIQCGYGFVENFGMDPGVDEGSEEHVAANASEAIEIGDAHDVIVSRGTDGGGGKEGLVH